MSNNTIHNVRVTTAIRRNNSRNGNPTWSLETDHGTFTTETDGSVGYTIDNLTNSRFPSYAIGDNAAPVDLIVTARGRRVVGLQRNGEWLR